MFTSIVNNNFEHDSKCCFHRRSTTVDTSTILSSSIQTCDPSYFVSLSPSTPSLRFVTERTNTTALKKSCYLLTQVDLLSKKNFHLSNLYFAGARNRSPAKQGRHGHALLSGDDAQVYNLRQKLLLLLQVMMHKAIMAFSLGLNIAQSSLSVRILNMRLRIV